MANFAFNLPINPVSFGQVSTGLLKETFSRSLNPSLFPIGEINLSTQKNSPEFEEWIKFCVTKGAKEHDRKTPCIRLWHIFDSMQSYSEKQILLSFYELDRPTEEELNIVKNNTTVFTSKFTQDVFKEKGVEVKFTPLYFDKENFNIIKDENGENRKYFDDDRITFNITGKFEKRKHHQKIIRAWSRRFGNDKKYFHFGCFLCSSKGNSETVIG